MHFSKKTGGTGAPIPDDEDDDGDSVMTGGGVKRPHQIDSGTAGGDEEDLDAKRRRILAETRDIDADDDSEEDDEDSSDEDSDDDDDAELQRELERVRREREEKKKKEEAERAKAEEEERERNIALGNPLLNKQDFTMKRRWDDDVVFKNQARGTEDRLKKKEFVNVSLPVCLLTPCASPWESSKECADLLTYDIVGYDPL